MMLCNDPASFINCTAMYLILYILIDFWQILKCHRSIYGYTLCLLDVQTCLWSDYKHHCMIKFLVCITANGAVSWVSPVYDGGSLDIHIVRYSGFLDLLVPFDQVMAEIQNQNWSGIKAMLLDNTSKCSKRQPNGKKDVRDTSNISNVCIHVEQPIRRLKEFRTLEHQQPLLYLPILNDIIQVISSLVNLKGPLTD